MCIRDRIWHERGREVSVRAETFCGESCAPQDASRMPRLPKNKKIFEKTLVLVIFGPRAPSGPVSALFPGVGCAAGLREAHFIPPQRGVAILGACAWGGGGSASRLSGHRPRLPRLPCLPHRTAWSVWKPQRGCVAATERLCGSHTGCLCVEATQRLCGSHTEAVWQPHGLCGSHTGAVAVPQQHIVAVEKPQQLCWLCKEAICCLTCLLYTSPSPRD